MNNILLSAYDPRYFEIVLHRSRYLNHIQMQHFITVDSIREGIENPDFIVQDVNNDFVENYYAQGVLEDDPDAFLKICVLFKIRSRASYYWIWRRAPQNNKRNIMAKMSDFFSEKPRLKLNQLDSVTLSPEKIWANYDELTDSVVLFFTGKPVKAISVYIEDDIYVMVDPQSRDVVGIHIEALEKKFLASRPLLQASWPHVQQTLSGESSSLLCLFSFGLAFLVNDREAARQIT